MKKIGKMEKKERGREGKRELKYKRRWYRHKGKWNGPAK
jgi:hypothetical protein